MLQPTTKGATVDHAASMRKTYERINAGDIAGFGALVADDYVEHQGGPGLPPTKEGTLEFFRILLDAFPDMQMSVEDMIASGDRAVARVSVTGTHKGEFMGVPPTGSRVDIQIVDIMRFNDAGLVCEHWGVADMLSLMQQLGAVPAGSQHPNAATVRSGYEAMSKGDMAAMTELLDDDIVWHESTPGAEGDYHGRDQVVAMLGGIMQEMERFELSLHDVLASDDHVVVLLDTSATRNGQSFSARYADVYHVRDGKASEHWHLAVDPKAEEAFWAS